MNWALEYKKTRESDVARKNVDEFKIVKERRGAPLVEMVGNWQNRASTHQQAHDEGLPRAQYDVDKTHTALAKS